MCAYVPPHKRPGAGPGGRDLEGSKVWTTLDSLVTPDDSVSVVAERSTVPLVELSESQVSVVLHNLGLGKYAAACMQVPLRGRDLAHCEEGDLEEIGINFRPHRRSLLEEVAAFKASGVPTHMLLDAAPPPPVAGPSADGRSDAPSETPTWIKSARAHLTELGVSDERAATLADAAGAPLPASEAGSAASAAQTSVGAAC
jgi:hypothetical protein